jgi:tetratricopeptide (TPR) repeat protein
MTKHNSQDSMQVGTFEDRVEILAGELELSIKWQRPCVLLVVYNSSYVRADVETALANHLIDLGQKTAALKIQDQNTNEVIDSLREIEDPADTVLFIEGLRWGHGKETSVYTTLNLQREMLLEKRIRMILWLTQNEAMDLARHAPDFWTQRQRVIEFAESPKAEQVLQGALDSAWHGVGEYAGQFDDTDEKISLRESLLTELPQEAEASSTRANLLLTLGILNWRKGDYEKADELLREALKIATLIQDTWFEAECFNAIALVKTSMERIDDAINAYKQAIQLAPGQIFAWNNLGNLCARIGRNDEAIVVFLKAIECNPKDPIGWNGLGNVYFKIGYVDDAIAAYRKSIKFMPTFAHPWSGLGDVYAHVGRMDEAIAVYRKAIELNKQYVAPWLRLASLFNKQGLHREAVKAFQRALNLDPGNAAIWNDLGAIHLKSGAYNEASDAFTKAIELDRGHALAYGNLASVYVEQGMHTEALPLCLRSVELLSDVKDKAAAYNRLGDVYRLLNDYDNAIAAYQTADLHDLGKSSSRLGKLTRELEFAAMNQDALEIPVEPSAQPAVAVSEIEVSDLVQENGSSALPEMTAQDLSDAPYWIFNPTSNSHVEVSSTAIEARPEATGADMPKPVSLTKALPETAPKDELEEPGNESKNPLVWNEKGNVHFKRQAFDEAISAYNRAIQLDPAFGWPYSNLALTYLILGQYAEAILLYQKSIELMKADRDKAVSWNGLGNVYRCLNDYPNAVAAYQKAAELDPETNGMRDGAESFQISRDDQSTEMWNDLGELFFKTGAHDEAIRAFNKAIELEPHSGAAYNHLAYVLAARGQFTEAIPLYQKSLELFRENKDKTLVWNRLGNVYRKLNDYENAMKAYQEAVKLSGDSPSLLDRTRFSLLSNVYVGQ